MEITPEMLGPSGSRHAADEDEMQIVYVMDVIDPLERPNGARYVRRFTYETREQAWARYSEAIRFGFEAYVDEVGRTRVTTQTTAHEHLSRSSVAAWRAPRDSALRERRRSGQRRNPGGGDAVGLPGSASR
jgi:hypothetical protein